MNLPSLSVVEALTQEIDRLCEELRWLRGT
jgi:hypothetical protein